MIGFFEGVRAFADGMRSGKATLLLISYYGMPMNAEESETVRRMGMQFGGDIEPHGLAVLYLSRVLNAFDGDAKDPKVRTQVERLLQKAMAAKARGERIAPGYLDELSQVAKVRFSVTLPV